MEPTSERQNQESAVRNSGADTPDSEARYVCKVCRGEIDPTVDRRLREQLVHRDCRAELRCGVSVRR